MFCSKLRRESILRNCTVIDTLISVKTLPFLTNIKVTFKQNHFALRKTVEGPPLMSHSF